MIGRYARSLLPLVTICCAEILQQPLLSVYAQTMTEQTANWEFGHIEFDSQWEVLGPFQIGTREAAWGADPLELLGGFHSLSYDTDATFKSSLAPNGTIAWGLKSQAKPRGPSLSATFDFTDVAWPNLETVYGWSNLQWQAWARSCFFVPGDKPRTYILYLTGVLEYWLDNSHIWGGDYYGLMLSPKVLLLTPGKHQIDLRLVRDVRVMGASSSPDVNVTIRLVPIQNNARLIHSDTLLPDVVDGRFISSLGSVVLTNVQNTPITINRIVFNETNIEATLLNSKHTVIQPGQSRPIAFRINSHGEVASTLAANIEYSTQEAQKYFLLVTMALRRRQKNEPQKYTYLHPGNIVSYAVLRPPPIKAAEAASSFRRLPVLLFLHGSGITADSDAVVTSLNATQDLDAWTVFASGVTAWCGDDWHNWGWADVEAAIKAVPGWIDHTQWRGPGIDDSRWLVTGHSNGGQGVWYALAHHPDRLIAAAPAAGYISLQAYVPYNLWMEVEPARSSLIQSALSSYRLELLVPWNVAGIPIGIQHGSLDDNVPVQHSRRMHQLLVKPNSIVSYNEVPGVGHVFEGMMSTRFLTEFFTHWLSTPDRGRTVQEFSLVTANPSDTGPKHGIHIEQLIVPGRLGKVEVEVRGDKLILRTSNVRQIGVCQKEWKKALVLDHQDLHRVPLSAEQSFASYELVSKTWQIAAQPSTKTHLGGLDAILRTQSTLSIVTDSDDVTDIALQISSNLLAYFGADSIIANSPDEIPSLGNKIVVGMGLSGVRSFGKDFPITVDDTHIRISTQEKDTHEYQAEMHGLGAIFLQPGEGEELEIVVWGTDQPSLDVAARLMPMMTGTGQPDFVIMDRSTKWRGLDGVLAMGFFDGSWQISRSASFFG